MNFILEHNKRDNCCSIKVSGEIDGYTAPGLRAKICDCRNEAKYLILDLKEVPFCDSQGLSVLVAMHKSVKNLWILVEPEGNVIQTINLCGLDKVLNICYSIADISF